MATKISSAQLQERFEQFKAQGALSAHMKKGRFLSRPARKGELILTVVVGQLETIHVAESDEVVLQNIMIGSSAERYVMASKVFAKRYEKTGHTFDLEGVRWEEVEAQGIIEAVKVTSQAGVWTEDASTWEFVLTAPWGEDMLVLVDDWIARPILADLSVPNPADIYRIEGKTFNQTYTPFEGEDAQRRLARFNAQRVAVTV